MEILSSQCRVGMVDECEILSQKQEKYGLHYCSGMLSQMEVSVGPFSHGQYITQKCFYLWYVDGLHVTVM